MFSVAATEIIMSGAQPQKSFCFQLRHQRAPSGSREFKELTKKDAQIQLGQELDKLLVTAVEEKKSVSKFERSFFYE